MKRLCIILCSLGIVAFGCSKTSHVSDAPALQGTWTGQESGGNQSTMTLDGSNFEFHDANTNEWYKATFTLREDTNPKQMTIVISDCPAPQFVGKTSFAIYKLENGMLTIVGSKPGNPKPPASFDAPGTRKLVFRK